MAKEKPFWETCPKCKCSMAFYNIKNHKCPPGQSRKTFHIDFLHEPYDPVTVRADDIDAAIILGKAIRIKKNLPYEVKSVTEE